MAKVLNTVESANTAPLSYEGGKRMVGAVEKGFELTFRMTLLLHQYQPFKLNFDRCETV